MFYLITGGSGSGKSEYAENLARKLGKSTAPDTEAAPLYYIATMRVWDEEGRARVRKHRLQREGKGFLTLERFTDMEKLELPETKTPFLSHFGVQKNQGTIPGFFHNLLIFSID